MESLPLELKSQVESIISSFPPSKPTFDALIEHFTQDDPKRRKISALPTESLPPSLQDFHIVLQIPELSLQSPIRKKLNLIFATPKNAKSPALVLSKGVDTQPEIMLDNLSSGNVTFAAILRVPEKKELRNLLIFYKQNRGDMFKNEPILIQYNDTLLNEQFSPILQKMDFGTYLQRQCSLCGFQLIDSTSKEMRSFFVDAYKGSKEGTLYFLPNHIIFGFKKPILMFKSTDIDSITYTSITRVTFNVTLMIVPADGDPENSDRFEFSMIDQQEFNKIDQYVRSKEFRDRSMTEELKAKIKMKNADKPGALAEAARMVPGGAQIVDGVKIDDQDSDDPEDENYQFANEEGESEISGEENSEDDDEDGDEDSNDDSEDDSGEDEGEDENDDIDLGDSE
ncbi:unnamed protein product [Kuraishia capsulata CBS 1993]|uniref:Histone chaperone RTT106 n=1 Tax=Kuraishia capsulata CBS 1993 TaxID=1382522 RepID=W6MIR9_9ASCO|nr:uncharacterized protein KUCA_T00002017001 [Kuraishia capsulata CBS 1993]CDK26046.1 unnamed protein product [Kuraishia capsulata CBS 1993]